MDKNIQQFVANSLKALQKQIDEQGKLITKLEKRLSRLEPPHPEGEYIVRNAAGNLVINIQPREEDGATD